MSENLFYHQTEVKFVGINKTFAFEDEFHSDERSIFEFRELGAYRVDDRNDSDLISTSVENDNNYDQFIKCTHENCFDKYNALKFEISSNVKDSESFMLTRYV